MKTYTLTLTYNERRAIDLIGHRSSNGDDLYHLLWLHSGRMPECQEWGDRCAINFALTQENLRRLTEIRCENSGLWPGFAQDMAGKLDALCNVNSDSRPCLHLQRASNGACPQGAD